MSKHIQWSPDPRNTRPDIKIYGVKYPWGPSWDWKQKEKEDTDKSRSHKPSS